MTADAWSREVAARTLWQEARGEPREGQEAVAHVLWNRVRDGRWGKTLAEVCLYPLQFSGWNAHDPNRMAAARLADDDLILNDLRNVLTLAETAADHTDGALFYYNPKLAAPAWAPGKVCIGMFGNQVFLREKRGK